MRDPLIIAAFSVLPRSTTSKWMGRLARTSLSRAGVRLFVRAYGVDLSEAEGEPGDYGSLNAFFTRRLKPGARPVCAQVDALVSPVDGTVAFAGRTEQGLFEVAPGQLASVADIVGEAVEGERDVAVLYLSPRDYHRVHSPIAGAVTRWHYVPGTLWPVFPAAVRGVKGLFGRNERLVTHIEADHAGIEMVMVGAFGVGRMEAVFTDLLSTLHHTERSGTSYLPLVAGGDFGAFHLGSTVIVVTPPGAWTWSVAAGEAVKMGQLLATPVPQSERH